MDNIWGTPGYFLVHHVQSTGPFVRRIEPDAHLHAASGISDDWNAVQKGYDPGDGLARATRSGIGGVYFDCL